MLLELVGLFVITTKPPDTLALISLGLSGCALIFATSVALSMFCAWLVCIVVGLYVPATICNSLFAVPLPITRLVLTLPCASYIITMLPLYTCADKLLSAVALIILAMFALVNAVPAGYVPLTNGIVAPLIIRFSPVLSAITGSLTLESWQIKCGLP